MTIGKKLTLGFVALLVLMTTLGGVTIISFKRMNTAFTKAIDKEKETQTKGLVELACAVAAEQHTLETSGKLTRAEAQERTKDMIRHMRYGDGGYLWINDLQPAMIMHPIRPDLDGKDLSNYTDPLGNHMFLKFVSAAKTQGGGFVPYMWPKPGKSAPVRKISYVKAFEPWGWVIGTGVYADDVDASASEQWTSGIRQSRTAAIAVWVLVLIIGAVFVTILREMNATLREVTGDLSTGAEQLAAASSEISSAAQSLAQSASEQAATIEEISSTSEEINSMSSKNAENARSAAELMDATAARVLEGDRKLHLLVESMQQIDNSSNEISKIVKLIDEIAFQTNILALNASVEAARAGNAGAGFGVVADEVRNLAQRCAQAAKDTEQLIARSIDKSNEGKQKLHEVTAAITAITDDVRQFDSLIHEISEESRDQAQSIQQIKHAMNQMEQVTQRNAAGAQETAASGEELKSHSNTLRTIVARLSKFVGSSAN